LLKSGHCRISSDDTRMPANLQLNGAQGDVERPAHNIIFQSRVRVLRFLA
jgi:hypothetical protein